MSTTSQDNWVDRLKGPEEARNEAIEELRSLLVRGLSKSLAQRYGGEVFAEDIAQEALLKILDSLDTFEGRSRFTTWAMTIATRIGISELRRRYYQDVSLNAIEQGEELRMDLATDDAISVGQQADQQEILNTLQELIDHRLSEKQRLAVRASLEGLPMEEIARRTGSNRNAVYKLVHDARLRLKAGLEESGIHAEDIQTLFN